MNIPSSLLALLFSLTLCSTTCEAEVNCGSQSAGTCAECPQECNGDCTWHPHTKLCRDAFSDELRTASVHLRLSKPDVNVLAEPAWWFQRVIPIASADATYFATNGHKFGYGGIQQVDGNTGRVIFSLWDQGGCDQDVNPNCKVENVAKTTACGTGVTCTPFGNEGTGRRSFFDVEGGVFPLVGKEYFFVTQAAYLGNSQMEYTGYFYLDGEWKLLSRIQVSTNSNQDWSINYIHTFVEQWDEIDTTKDRGALFGPSFMAPVDGSNWYQVPSATFTHGILENHERVNAWQAGPDKDNAVGIETGGNVEREASIGDTFYFPPMTKPYDSLEAFSHKVQCLNDAATKIEIEDCLATSSTDSPSKSPTSFTLPVRIAYLVKRKHINKKKTRWFPKLVFIFRDTNRAKIKDVTITLAWMDMDNVTNKGTVTQTTKRDGKAFPKLPKFKTSGKNAVKNVRISVVKIETGDLYEYNAELNKKDGDECPLFSNNCPVMEFSLD